MVHLSWTSTRLGVAVVFAALLMGSGATLALAADTPSYNNGDCWQAQGGIRVLPWF